MVTPTYRTNAAKQKQATEAPSDIRTLLTAGGVMPVSYVINPRAMMSTPIMIKRACVLVDCLIVDVLIIHLLLVLT